MAKMMGERLVEAGLVSPEAVKQGLQQQRITGHRLGDCLVDLGFLTEEVLLRFLAADFKVRFVTREQLDRVKLAPELLDRIPVRMAEAQLFLPLAMDLDRKAISVAVAEPQNQSLLSEIALVAEMSEVYPFVALRSAIQAAIRKHYYSDPTAFATKPVGLQPAQRPFDISSGGISQPSVVVFPEADPRAKKNRFGSSRRHQPSQLREALWVVRGAVGENDFIETLNILVGLLELTKPGRRGHSAQLARQAAAVARRMGLEPRAVSQVSIAAYLHELGKPADKHLTLANNAQNPSWKAEAKRYARAPVRLFETVHLPGAVNAILAQLYETFDGSGVPQGAKGDDIAIGARVLAAVDAALDLTRNEDNAFGRLFSKGEALTHLQENAGKLYDPEVVALIAQLYSGELLRERLAADGRHILVAHPDEGRRTELIELFSEHGLVAHAVPKLNGAADTLISGGADALAVSVNLGAPDIASLTQFIRTQPDIAGVPVVVFGEVREPNARAQLADAGISRLVSDVDLLETLVSILQERLEHGSPGHPVQGSFDELEVAEVLHALSRGRKYGRLSIGTGEADGVLHFEKGRVLYAGFEGKLGEPALEPLLTLRSAEFRYDPEALLLELPNMDKDLEVIARDLETWTAKA